MLVIKNVGLFLSLRCDARLTWWVHDFPGVTILLELVLSLIFCQFALHLTVQFQQIRCEIFASIFMR